MLGAPDFTAIPLGYVFAEIDGWGGGGSLVGLGSESAQQIRGNFARSHPLRLPIAVASGPACVVPSGHAHVRVAELGRHIAELDTAGRELAGKGVPKVLQPDVAQVRSLQDAAPLSCAEVVWVGIPQHVPIRRGLEVAAELCENVLSAP